MREATALAFSGQHSAGGKNSTSEQKDASNQKVTKSAKEKVKYRRRTIELHPDMEKLLDELRDDLKVKSQTDVMQKAIQFLGYIRGLEDGVPKKIYIEGENGKLRELVIL